MHRILTLWTRTPYGLKDEDTCAFTMISRKIYVETKAREKKKTESNRSELSVCYALL